MNQVTENIKQRLSLREPLCRALDVVAQITDKLSLSKPPVSPEQIEKNGHVILSPQEKAKMTEELETYLNKELALVKEVFPSCTNFERDFPSVAFSIATGIGKTRLIDGCLYNISIPQKRHSPLLYSCPQLNTIRETDT